jgi:hypothetical protein
MAGPKIETGNPAAVVVLLVVLVGAIGFTFVRIAGPRAVDAAPAPTVSVASRPSEGSDNTHFRPKLNPFKKPAGLEDMPSSPTAGPGRPALSGQPYSPKMMPLLPINDFKVEPISGSSPGRPAQSMTTSSQPEPEKPSFTLLTTVRSGNRITGVIRIGDSQVRTVGVGDVLDGGFVVQELSTDRAVLTNGKETIIADKEHLRDKGRLRNGSS